MKHDFSLTPSIDTPRSRFDRSFGHKFTCNAGYLIPFLVDPVLPGDTYNVNTSMIARMTTPFKPIMDNMYVDTQFFFVPLRQIWDNSRKFFGERVDPGDSIDYTIPKVSSFTPAEMSLYDYFGLPVNGNALSVNNLPARAYNHIYNEWYRHEQLQDSVVVDTDDGPDTNTDYVLLQRCKRFDYFTSCLPAPQLGDAVSIPLGTVADVQADGIPTFLSGVAPTGTVSLQGDNTQVPQWSAAPKSAAGYTSLQWAEPSLTVDLTTAVSATVNDFREALQVQRLLERDARAGTRYAEVVKNHFGVNFYDVTYRPEYLGGGSTPINSTPVPATNKQSILPPATYVGDLGAYTTASFTGHGFTKSFVEHGYVIGILSIRADLTYQQGIPRDFLKETRYDVFWPTLQFLGEQAVTNAELYYQGNPTFDDAVFGYIPRYDEYRFKNSMITGVLRSTASSPLDVWHLSQEFSSLPTLGNTFIVEDPPMDRIMTVATSSAPQFVVDTYTSMICARPMAMHAIPGMMDHF